MGSLKRIFKNLFALVVANITMVANQLLLPPIFLHQYGIALYGEWLALSVGVAYLRTLNFGVQTYVNQDLALRFHRGEIEGYHVRQSTALRLLLGICGGAALLSPIIFLLPISHILRLSISNQQATLATFLLAMQVLVNILFGYFSGIFMVIEKAHRGTQWNNGQRMLFILATVGAILLHVSFAMLAFVQLATYAVVFVAVMIDLKRTAPQIFPNVKHWDRSSVSEILKRSGHFGLIYSCTFLAFEAPVLVLQRIVGPASVVAFTLMRTIFSMGRQILAVLTQSLGPEITALFGKRDWRQLRTLYGYSEQLIFACIPTVNLAILVASPWLLSVWRVNKSGMFQLYPYVVCAAISIVMATEEHKYQFQFATNSHEKLARFMFGSYLVMVTCSIPLVRIFGIMGFLGIWLVTEVAQLIYIVHLNHQLFDTSVTGVEKLTLRNLTRMLALSLAGLVAAGATLRYTAAAGHGLQIASTIATVVLVGGVSYLLFDLRYVAGGFVRRIRGRFAQQQS
jgi:O-antigen/teichoic acid export membrane protein